MDMNHSGQIEKPTVSLVGWQGVGTISGRFVYLRDLLRELVKRDIKLRYKRSILGFLWTLVHPLAQLLVLSFVFRVVVPIRIPHFTSFLFTGLIVWSWFQSSLILSTGAIVENRDLIKRPGFPTSILPIVTVTSTLVHFLMAFPILLLFLKIDHLQFTSALLAIPAIIVLQYLLTLAFAYLVATSHVAFRDTQYLLTVALLLGFYMTPIFYDISRIPERYRALYSMNPMAQLISAYRSILLHGSVPDPMNLAVLAVVFGALLWLGHYTFKRMSAHFAEVV
jgi:lipopolysaccharide transport system permease protein